VQADMGALADRTAAAGASEAAARFLVERLAGTTELKRAA